MHGRNGSSRLGCAVLAALVLCAGLANADPLIRRAAERKKAGDADAAAGLLLSWLAVNPGAPGSPRVFGDYFTLEQDFPRLVAESRDFLVGARGLPGAGTQFLRIARLFDVAGRVEEARDAYVAAAQNGVSDEALLSAFLLSLEMNDAATMKGVLASLAGKEGNAGMLLDALASLQTGDDAKARATLVGLAGQTGDPVLAVRALWVLYATAAARGDATEMEALRTRLKARFPSAPETALTAGGAASVVLAPGPDPFPPARSDGTIAAPPAPGPSTAAGTPVPSAVTYSVQVGSFRMKDNADDLVAELTKRGFTPTVIQDSPQGKERYRVFAGAGLDADDARAVLTRLSRAGLSGFLVADK